LLTGYRPDQLGIYDLSTKFRAAKPDAVTLPQTFMRAGYHAEALGKIYHKGHGNDDDAQSWNLPTWYAPSDAPAFAEGAPSMPPGAIEAPPRQGEVKRGPPWGWPDVSDNETKDGQTARYAVQRLEVLSKAKQPFFLAVGFIRPHLPFIVPKKYWDMFQRNDLPFYSVDASRPIDAPPYAWQDSDELRQYGQIQTAGTRFTEQQARALVHGYYAATAFIDVQIGLLLDAVEKNNLQDNTIIVLWGDHGWHLGDHGMWCKHTNYEQAAKNPLIMVVPGKKAGQKSLSFAATIDIYPTLCALAGLSAPKDLPGKNLVPILDDAQASVQDSVVHVFPRIDNKQKLLGRAIRTADWRYVEWRFFDDARTLHGEELYDMKNDPSETKNMVADAQYAEVVTSLRAKISTLGSASPQVKKRVP
jgi:iduronate 2-sulfatase